jgi:hypothetical protein
MAIKQEYDKGKGGKTKIRFLSGMDKMAQIWDPTGRLGANYAPDCPGPLPHFLWLFFLSITILTYLATK